MALVNGDTNVKAICQCQDQISRSHFSANGLYWGIIFSQPQLLASWLTLSQTTNFRYIQTERVCRWQFQIGWKWQKVLQFQIGWKWQKVLQMGRKHGKWRYCSLLAISPFLSVFKMLVLQTYKNQGLFGRGLNLMKFNMIRFLCVTLEKNVVIGENAEKKLTSEGH